MRVDAYVDGSFNASTNIYGGGVVLILENDPDNPIYTNTSGNDEVFAKSRNVAGEVLAACLAMQACKAADNVTELVLHYDYAGIECWARGRWKANTPIARSYAAFVRDFGKTLSFRKVKAHSGDLHNEQADRLAKSACGLL